MTGSGQDEQDEGPDPRIGTTLNERYRIVKRIGVGGMGVVYEGLHLLIQRRVAIKMLHAEYMRNSEIRARFKREAIAATTIRHPHIVEVFDMGTAPDGAAYMVLEFLDGRDWAQDIERGGAQPLGKAVRILRQVCDGLQAAHDKHIVHRDLKPENVFLAHHGSDRDFVKIVDFGISKILDEPDAPADNNHSLTKTGAAMGTPYAMAPEQMHGVKDIDHRADVWALGIMLFRALTGAYPFDADSFPLLAVKLLTGAPPPLSDYRQDLPPEIQAIVSHLLDKNRATRFQSAREVRDALEPYENHREAPVLTGTSPFAMAATFTPATPGVGVVPAHLRAATDASPSPAPAPAPTTVGHRVTPPASTPVTPTVPLAAGVASASATGPIPGEFVRAANAAAPPTLEVRPPAAPASPGVWTGVLLASVLIALGGGGAVVALRAVGSDPPTTTASAPPPSSVVEAPPSAVEPAGPVSSVRVQIATQPEHAELLLDGNPIPNPFDADLPTSTERHTIETRAAGYVTDTREVSLAFPMRITIELAREGAARSPRHGETPHGPTPTTQTTPPPTTQAVVSHEEASPPPPPPPPPPPSETDRLHSGLSNPFAP